MTARARPLIAAALARFEPHAKAGDLRPGFWGRVELLGGLAGRRWTLAVWGDRLEAPALVFTAGLGLDGWLVESAIRPPDPTGDPLRTLYDAGMPRQSAAALERRRLLTVEQVAFGGWIPEPVPPLARSVMTDLFKALDNRSRAGNT